MARAHLALALALVACDAGRTVEPRRTGGGGGQGSPVCGNGRAEAGELCDGADLAGRSCEALGLGAGTLVCDRACIAFDSSGCGPAPRCGDGKAEGAEACDGTDLKGVSCARLGLGGGTLACNAACSFDASGCAVADRCGNGRLDPGERCDTGIASGAAACPASCAAPMGCVREVLTSTGCAAHCASTTITAMMPGDGCCPAGATRATDSDCAAGCGDGTCGAGESCASCPSDCGACCGNGLVDPDERCDVAIASGAGRCPTSCVDGDACTSDLLEGTECRARCSNPPITQRVGGDMCCPMGATMAEDPDCAPMSRCGDHRCDAGEDCASCAADCGCAMGQLCEMRRCTAACGNGRIDAGEVCDGAALASQSCASRGFGGGALACNPSCTAFDETGCTPAGPGVTGTLLIAGNVYQYPKQTRDGRAIAALVNRSSSTGTGSLRLVGVAPPQVSTLGSLVSSFDFSPDDRWLAFVDEHSNQGGGGREILKLVSSAGGLVETLGMGLNISPSYAFSSSSRHFAFVEEFDYARGGRLRVRDLVGGGVTTIDTGVLAVDASPTDGSFIYSKGYNSTLSHAELWRVLPPGPPVRLGVAVPANSFSHQCVLYAQSGGRLFFVSDLSGGFGRLNALDAGSSAPRLLVIGVAQANACMKLSTDGRRVAYLTSYDAQNSSGVAWTVAATGGAPIALGSVVGWIRFPWTFGAEQFAYLDDFIDGFNTDRGTLTRWTASGGAPIVVRRNVKARYATAPGDRAIVYAADFDESLGRGRLEVVDLVSGAVASLAADADEWVEYAPDGSRALLVAAHDEARATGRLEIADIPSGANRRVIAATAHDYRFGFTPDGQSVFYQTAYDPGTGAGDVILDRASGGRPIVVVPASRVVSSHRFAPDGAHFTVRASPGGASRYVGALTLVRVVDGATVNVDPAADSAEWLGPRRFWFVRSGATAGLYLVDVR